MTGPINMEPKGLTKSSSQTLFVTSTYFIASLTVREASMTVLIIMRHSMREEFNLFVSLM